MTFAVHLTPRDRAEMRIPGPWTRLGIGRRASKMAREATYWVNFHVGELDSASAMVARLSGCKRRTAFTLRCVVGYGGRDAVETDAGACTG